MALATLVFIPKKKHILGKGAIAVAPLFLLLRSPQTGLYLEFVLVGPPLIQGRTPSHHTQIPAYTAPILLLHCIFPLPSGNENTEDTQHHDILSQNTQGEHTVVMVIRWGLMRTSRSYAPSCMQQSAEAHFPPQGPARLLFLIPLNADTNSQTIRSCPAVMA